MYFDVNNSRVFASTGGKGFDRLKRVVVFLSGSGFDHSFWSLQTRFFARRNFSVLVPDYPGHGRSGAPVLTDIEALADWVHVVLKVLRVDKVSLVGHSQGCLVALEFASQFAECVSTVSFIASGLATPVNPKLLAAAQQDPAAAIDKMLSWGFAKVALASGTQAGGQPMLAASRRIMRRNAPDALLADLKACDAYAGGARAAENITCPQQLILAGDDRMAPRTAGMQLARHLRNPELHVLDGFGHMLPLEAPAACSRLLHEFISAENPACGD